MWATGCVYGPMAKHVCSAIVNGYRSLAIRLNGTIVSGYGPMARTYCVGGGGGGGGVCVHSCCMR